MIPRTLAIALTLVPWARAQRPPDRAAVAAAQQQIQNRQWNEARTLLKQLDADCLAARNSNGCRPLLDYSIAYLNQQEAATAPAAERLPLLTEARRRYQSVLELQPTNAATLNSLALVEQAMLAGSRPQGSAALVSDVVARWTRAIEVDDSRSAQYRVALGDFLAAENRQAEALVQFQRAAGQDPHEETARRRILDLSGALPVNAYMNLCTGWEGQFPALASECYERLIARAGAKESNAVPAENENLLLRWTALESRRDAMTLDRLKAVPRGWMTNEVSELRTYVEKPWANAKVWRWWWERPDRSAVTAEVAIAMGRQALSDPQAGPRLAAQCWEGLLNERRSLTEEVARFERPGRPMAAGLSAVLRLHQELASLYHRHPELDPGGTKLNRLVQDLFNGKAMFIAERNWKATQPVHAVLAQIFVERGVWEKGVAGAAYQLRATLDDAERRWKDPEERFFQPLPEIKKLLAETYMKIGAARKTDASRMYLEAAKAYLDTDALGAAQTMLGMVAETGTPAAQAEVAQVTRILAARRAPAAATAAIDARAPWLYSASNTMTPEFLARQRFKLQADAASTAPAGAQLAGALKTYDLVSKELPVLVGTADVVRWRQAESRLLASVNASVSASVAIPAVTPGATNPTRPPHIRVTLDGENRPLEIPLPPDTMLAAQVVTTLGTADALTARPFVTLRQGKVVVTHSPAAAPSVDRLLVKIRQDPKIPLVVNQ